VMPGCAARVPCARDRIAVAMSASGPLRTMHDARGIPAAANRSLPPLDSGKSVTDSTAEKM
jgi:hypothetical protein